ncbi:uncharacterized protein LOC124470113 isoform X1 [Hypomesus transpacificus]|uniref:uncharacterized protein LOC124470113 isoform X1 n=2 Tax=Hypomesus transpacificus TaxID=137520 RepID=UPI001F082BE4|nr:uncharacterized protein LOC124470113 isoform X1 [Hypomesus transpacificus]
MWFRSFSFNVNAERTQTFLQVVFRSLPSCLQLSMSLWLVLGAVGRHTQILPPSIPNGCRLLEWLIPGNLQERYFKSSTTLQMKIYLKDPAVALATKGYHVLLEKPMAVSTEDCTEIVETCIQSGVMLTVCHVLRYDPVIRKIKELIDSGVIGEVIHIQHLEPVGFYHFAHSFVRGNWRNEAESSFALLAKCCHDIDLIHHWAGGRRCLKVSSFGSLSHFRKECKPPGAGDRCLHCPVEGDCSYSARKIYLDRVKQGHTGWPVSVICPSSLPDIESVTDALKTGPYGRCVYECDNDVCTNQVVNMEFDGGLTASFSMVAFTEEICQRRTTIYGSKGELSYNGNEIRVFDFLTQRATKHKSNVPGHFGMGGHSGADYHLVDAFISAVASGDASLIRSGPRETLRSHKLVFEAERARLESKVVFCETDP